MSIARADDELRPIRSPVRLSNIEWNPGERTSFAWAAREDHRDEALVIDVATKRVGPSTRPECREHQDDIEPLWAYAIDQSGELLGATQTDSGGDR